MLLANSAPTPGPAPTGGEKEKLGGFKHFVLAKPPNLLFAWAEVRYER
jgi:hypothetical protein